MKLAINNLSYTERYDLKREASVFCNRQANAHLGDTPKRDDELMAIGAQGHYETMFRIIHEECELAARMALKKID